MILSNFVIKQQTFDHACSYPSKENQMMDYCKIKLLFLILGILVIGIDMRADSEMRSHNVYVDLFGSSNIVSVNYDARFGGSSGFGWRAGVGYSASGFNHPNRYGFLPDYRSGISLPLGVNALLGEHVHKFEIGVGVTPSLAAFRESETDDFGDHLTHNVGPSLWRGACAFSIDLGYRLQRKNGFMFRAGISPCLDVNGTCVSIHMLSLLPYLSFGYTFN